MAKPFSKNQVGYMRHRKFLALNANAIALWHEGKDYCSEHLTDGLIPAEAVKGFRFRSAKAIELLTASCGEKPDGSTYAPLWERHPVGFKMHDYLAHNDAYEVVQERIAKVEERREGERRRQAEYRERERREAERRREQDTEAERTSRITSRVISDPVTPPTVPEPRRSPPNPPPGAVDRLVDAVVAELAGVFLERYPAIYAKARAGATYHVRAARDHPVAMDLIHAYTDVDYLCDMLELFLRKDEWKPKNVPGSPGQFRHMAPECDSELRRAQWHRVPRPSKVAS